MKRSIFFVFILCISIMLCSGQSAPNLANSSILSPTTQKASQLSTVPVNIFTGVPQVGVPIYSYNSANNGLSFNISLDYFAGGVQVGESSTSVGLGWFLNAGGVITRTVRGAPDDQPVNGFMYAGAIPADFRTDANKYYFDSLDAQQDIFHYNFNGRSGKFFIGKNGQIAVVPVSKIRIIPTIGTGAYAQRIIAFRIITEDGVKYDFSNTESTSITTKGADSSLFRSAYSGQSYFSSWYLSKVISTFNTDTIKINYTGSSSSSDFAYPQVTFVRNSDGVRTKTFTPLGSNVSGGVQLSSITFPGNTNVAFYYYGANISKIKIRDTAFRYGYSLDYITQSGDYWNPDLYRHLLSTVTPYTSREKKMPYQFFYNIPYFLALGSYYDTIQNKRDHWGYYNKANNGNNIIPQVNGYTWGANRNPDSLSAMRGSLRTFSIPNGGYATYDYELNDHLPFIKDPRRITVFPTVASSNTILLSQVFNPKHQLVFSLDSSISRSGTVPVSGTGNLTINIKNTAGTITYATYTLSVYDLYYQGIKSCQFNLPNGNYLLDIPAISGTSITGSFPIIITWENKLTDNTRTAVPSGGLRVKRVTLSTATDMPAASVQEYKYINTDGTSSGFLGDIPKYDYPYQETVNFGGVTTTSYTAVSSEPVNNMDYAQGSPVGYSRVEVTEGTATHNIGKTVYDFTNMQDINSGVFTATFPYAQQELRNWGIGLPKKIAVYDSTGRLIKKTVNAYAFDSSFFVNSNFKSIKMGNSFTYYNGDPNNAATPKTRTYLAQDYYPVSGRSYIVSSLDTLFQVNGTVNSSYANLTYDTNYNVIKSVSGYDRNRGLALEKRLYYAYNYSLGGSIGKLRDSSILSALIATENWITGDANPRIVSGTITDYQQTAAGFIKPLTVFALQANGPVAQATIGTFNPAVLNRNSSFFVPQSSFITYDNKGTLVQSQNIQSGINNALIMDYGQQYAVAKVTNAALNDIAYTSFEADGTGNWTIGSLIRDTVNALTGKKSYILSNGNISKTSLLSATTYIVTVWAKSGAAISINGAALTAILATQNNWNLYSTTITGVTSVTISGTGSIDELRLHPKDANMVTYTYEPLVGVSSMADANNTVIYNEYDNLNRLKIVRDKDKNILKRYDYTDTPMPITIDPIWGIYKGCRNGIDGYWDSTRVDINPYSDTYNSQTKVTLVNYCTCAPPANYPDYKTVNGVCEQAMLWCYTSSVWFKTENRWHIIYHYKWSDNSIGADITIYSSSSHSLGCLGAP